MRHIQNVLLFHHHLLQYQEASLLSNCLRNGNTCLYTAHPAQYFEDPNGNNHYSSQVSSETQLLDIINSAKNSLLNTDISVGDIFGGTTPSTLVFDSSSGRYNLKSASAIKFGYLLEDD